MNLALAEVIAHALRNGRLVRFRASGGSMEPFVPDGSLVAVAPCVAADVHRGDLVLVARPDGGLALHRMVAREASGALVTWGDALPAPDAWSSVAVLGRARVLARPARSFSRRARGIARAAAHFAIAAWLTGS